MEIPSTISFFIPDLRAVIGGWQENRHDSHWDTRIQHENTAGILIGEFPDFYT